MHGKPIVRASLPVGTVYERLYKGKKVQMSVVMTERGLAYRVGDTDFRTPTGAAKSVTGTAVNGWEFWRIDV